MREKIRSTRYMEPTNGYSIFETCQAAMQYSLASCTTIPPMSLTSHKNSPTRSVNLESQTILLPKTGKTNNSFRRFVSAAFQNVRSENRTLDVPGWGAPAFFLSNQIETVSIMYQSEGRCVSLMRSGKLSAFSVWGRDF